MAGENCRFCGGELTEMNGVLYCWCCDKNYILENGNLVALTCKSCGGNLRVKGAYYECEVCGRRTEKSSSPSPEKKPEAAEKTADFVYETPEILLFTDAKGYKEEAKRITDTINNFAFIGYRSPIGPHDRTREKARRFAAEKKFRLASEHYEAVLMEDDWESCFYSVLYEILGNPNLKYSVGELLRCIESAAERISFQVPKNKRRDTYLEVGMESLRAGLFLLETGEKEKTFPSRNPAIFSVFGEEDFEKLKEEVAVMMTSAAIIINNTFEDPFSAELIAKTANDICVLWGISGEIFQSLESSIEKLSEMTVSIKESAAEIKEKISALEKIRSENPEKRELEKFDSEIDSLIKKKDSLGFFKRNEKKEIEKEIENLSKKRSHLYGRIIAFEEAVLEEKEELEELLEEIYDKIVYR
ncbi:MAG: hypothetical protein IKL57_06745 [Oscillospiraceae bacterium]|nr:hypothetical protein [Oscillospiraceae bacterium]